MISSFNVLTEKGDEHQIKTISSGCVLQGLGEAEDLVLAAGHRSPNGDGHFEYLTHFADGNNDWRLAGSFISDDGSTNIAWLNFVSTEDLEVAFKKFTLTELRVLIIHLTKLALLMTPVGHVYRSRLETYRR